ncbi:MAG: type II secretion system protein GspJ [Deltaproteobacteria bacterium]|nr:type II secretion system protein GspJ [Deltaproteobacteria bacterium]
MSQRLICNAHKKESGFTLLELLLAMALMSLVAASLYGTLNIGFKAKKSAEEAVEKSRTVLIAMELIRREVMSALPPTGILAGQFLGTDETDSDGYDSDTILLHTSCNKPGENETGCDIRKTEISLNTPDDSEEQNLIRSKTTNLLAPIVLEPVEEILCNKVRALNFRYFDGYYWQDEWDSIEQKNALPIAVEVTLEIEKRDVEQPDEEDGYALTQAFILPCAQAL